MLSILINLGILISEIHLFNYVVDRKVHKNFVPTVCVLFISTNCVRSVIPSANYLSVCSKMLFLWA
jgi:hypothetical protein